MANGTGELIAGLLPGAIGGLVVLIGQLAIGRYNSSLKITPSVRRQPSRTVGFDDFVLELVLKKEGATRVRLESVDVAIQSGFDGSVEVAAKVKGALTASFARMALVPSDEVRFEAHGTVPVAAVLAMRLEISSTHLVFEAIPVGHPRWSSSIVSLPRASPLVVAPEVRRERSKDPDLDDLVLDVRVKQAPAAFDAARVTIEPAFDGSDVLAKQLDAALDAAVRRVKGPAEELRFEALGSAPRAQSVVLVVELLVGGQVRWSSSLVSLPLPPAS